MDKTSIDIERNTTKYRMDMCDTIIKIKKLLFELCEKNNCNTLIFDEKMYETIDRLYVVPAIGNPIVCQVIGFEIKKDRFAKEVQFMYMLNEEVHRCFIFETLNEESLWWQLTRVIDWYNSNVWTQD